MPEIKRPHGSRFRDALAIVDPGACNPSGIALSIAEACREIREHETSGTKEMCQDPAIRLMVYQLASICGVAEYALERYIADETACKGRLAELGLRPFGAG
jgi:hypothetical protein